MIAERAKRRDFDGAWALYHAMRENGTEPNEYALTTMINVCAKTGDAEQARGPCARQVTHSLTPNRPAILLVVLLCSRTLILSAAVCSGCNPTAQSGGVHSLIHSAMLQDLKPYSGSKRSILVWVWSTGPGLVVCVWTITRTFTCSFEILSEWLTI